MFGIHAKFKTYSYSRSEATEKVLSRGYSYSRSEETEKVLSHGYLNVCLYVRNIVTVTFRKNVISVGILENLESNCNF